MVIYKALDWGIDNHLERELSESLEKLISLLLKLDTEATKPAITFQDVLKVPPFLFLLYDHVNFSNVSALTILPGCSSVFWENLVLAPPAHVSWCTPEDPAVQRWEEGAN